MKIFFTCCITVLLISFQISAQLSPYSTCYTVAHNNGINNVLFKFNPQTAQWVEIGLTGTNNIKAIATDPINNIIYAVDGDTFGTINPQSGLFSAIGSIGTANGDYGAIILNDIEGLTFDPLNKIIYASHRIESGDFCSPTIAESLDLLFQIDVLTGKFMSNVMLDHNGNLADYAVIEVSFGGTDKYVCDDGSFIKILHYDVNDIAYNAYTGELYAATNQGYYGSISIINTVDAGVEVTILDLGKKDFIGLAFNSIGELFGTTGANAVDNQVNCFKYISLQNQLAFNLPFIDTSGINFDFSGLDCFTAYNDLALSLVIDPNTPNRISNGSSVTFLITVYNQGNFDNHQILVTNYIPTGLTLNDPAWSPVPGTNTAEFTIQDPLIIGANTTIPITFTVDETFTGETIDNYAEITTSYNPAIVSFFGDELPLPDIDSWPDDTNNELLDGDIVIDNVINQAGPNANEDEDDHDIATITIDSSFAGNLLLSTTIGPASCWETGSAFIEISDTNSVPPYTHKWIGTFGELVHLETNNNLIHTVSQLPPDTYGVYVNDVSGKISAFVVTIPVLATNNGNLNCVNSCPEYLTTFNGLLSGIFQAENVIEIYGEVTGTQGAEFRICE